LGEGGDRIKRVSQKKNPQKRQGGKKQLALASKRKSSTAQEGHSKGLVTGEKGLAEEGEWGAGAFMCQSSASSAERGSAKLSGAPQPDRLVLQVTRGEVCSQEPRLERKLL